MNKTMKLKGKKRERKTLIVVRRHTKETLLAKNTHERNTAKFVFIFTSTRQHTLRIDTTTKFNFEVIKRH